MSLAAYTLIELAKAAYEEYGDTAEWETFDGRPMPAWDDLPERTRTLWAMAAGRVQKMVINGKRED